MLKEELVDSSFGSEAASVLQVKGFLRSVSQSYSRTVESYSFVCRKLVPAMRKGKVVDG